MPNYAETTTPGEMRRRAGAGRGGCLMPANLILFAVLWPWLWWPA